MAGAACAVKAGWSLPAWVLSLTVLLLAAPWAPSHADGAPAHKVIEGAPEGGLAYRLLLGKDASPGKPARLVIWFHPTGGLMVRTLEEMAPLFVRREFALLVMTGKQETGWTDAEAARLFTGTLPEIAKIPGLDAARPVLFGFSGGGQLALALWRANPCRYGGVIVDAAYPVESKDGTQVTMDLPSDFAHGSAPLFVLVGHKDPLAKIWRQVQGAWRKAGVPLTIRYVPGKGHEWLFGEKETAGLDAWLSELRPGACPAGRAYVVAPPQEEPAPAVHP